MGRATSSIVFTALLAVAAGCPKSDAPPPKSAPRAADGPIDIDDPETCRECHEAIVVEWSQSMHARAHHSRDPIYAGVRRIREQREGAAILSMCAQCHTPRSVDDPNSSVAKVGVGCAACHNATSLHTATDKKGAAALELAGGTLLLGPNDLPADASDAHDTGAAPAHMKDGSSLCLTCHGELKSPAGIPICTTGPELSGAPDARKSCTSCHMPTVPGPSGIANDRLRHASHTFVGPHRAWYQHDKSFLAGSVDLDGTLQGGTLTLTIANRAGHAMPTGFPGRMAILRVSGRDATGAEVWSNWTDDPMKQDPQAVFNKVYVDDQGQPTLAPYAAALKRDNRLTPSETRTLQYAVPETVQSATVTLSMRLLPPPLADKLGLVGTPEAEPEPITTLQIARMAPAE